MNHPTPHTDLVRQLYAEHRNHMLDIERGAKSGNRVSVALMGSMPILKIKLQAIEALGQYVARKENEDASSA